MQVSLVRKRLEEGSQEADINSISHLVAPFLHFLKSLSFICPRLGGGRLD